MFLRKMIGVPHEHKNRSSSNEHSGTTSLYRLQNTMRVDLCYAMSQTEKRELNKRNKATMKKQTKFGTSIYTDRQTGKEGED